MVGTGLAMSETEEAFFRARAQFEMARQDAAEDVDSDAEFLLFDSALSDATRDLFDTPSPDLLSLTYKLQVFHDEEMYYARTFEVSRIINILIADVHRLIK